MPVAARTRYDTVALSLHWLIATLLIFMLFFGDELMEAEDGGSTFGPSLHVSVGSAILLLSVFRLIWRLNNPPPVCPASMAPWERTASSVTHLLFYVLLISIPLTGWFATPKFLSEEGVMAGLTVFGVFPLPGAPSLSLPMKGLHEIGSNLGIVLLALHVLAVLKHPFVNRDDVLRRMLPIGRSG
ncbi:MAG: cytochrome b [Aestuariivirga sp.]|nr:cytochrome b [Aestuariivirga sp.]